MKQTLKDYGINLKHVPLYYDNESAIKIANNPFQLSKTKHIEICHHFLRDHVIKEDIDIIHFNQRVAWRKYALEAIIKLLFISLFHDKCLLFMLGLY